MKKKQSMVYLAGVYYVERVQNFIVKKIEYPYVLLFVKGSMLNF